jgi:hypothetical protein
MRDLSKRPDAGWNIIFVLSLVAIGVIGGFYFHLRQRIPTGPSHGQTAQLAAIHQAIVKANAHLESDKKALKDHTWDISPDLLGSQTLGAMVDMADKSHLKLADFRTDPPLQVAHLTEVPMAVVVEGSFTDVMGLVSKLEDPKSKLAVTMLQVASSDVHSDRVTATVGLAGFLPEESS